MNCFFARKIAELRAGSTRSGTLAGGATGGVSGEAGEAGDAGGNAALAAAAGDGYIYDDEDNGDCVSVTACAPGGSGTEMAYGHYFLENKCAFPVNVLKCFAFNRADGTPAPDFDRFAEGCKCPGIGWGALALAAGERQDQREWYEYTQIKWEVKVCKQGWDFIGKDGRYPEGILGEPYRCRTRRKD